MSADEECFMLNAEDDDENEEEDDDIEVPVIDGEWTRPRKTRKSGSS